MGRSKRRVGTTAAVSAAALASLLGAPAASADGHEVCVNCVTPGPGIGDGGLANAFHKLSEKQFPGATADAFLKVGGQNAFLKLAGKEFPGNTGDVFFK